MYEYDEAFYQYLYQGAVRSAGTVLPAVLDLLPISVSSVLDVGCGEGAWLSVWKSLGRRIKGLDGDYVEAGQLRIAPAEFMAQNLTSGFSLGEHFDLVQCLEVAEHLPASASPLLVKSLCAHADVVLFSAAPPGQGGENHINEQPYAYWRRLFAAEGFRLYDAVRPQLLHAAEVMPWYRYNIFLYVNETRLPELHAQLANYAIESAGGPRDISPLPYRFRKCLVRALPHSVNLQLARLKKLMFNLIARFR